MARTLGYFSLSANGNKLIADIIETFGDDVTIIPRGDRFWLIGRLCHELWSMNDDYGAPSDEVTEIAERIDDFDSEEQVLSLVKALLQDKE